MTELGDQLVLALAYQGFGLVFTDDDLVVMSKGMRSSHHIPRILLEDPAFEPVLALVIGILEETLGLRWETDEGGEPGLN